MKLETRAEGDMQVPLVVGHAAVFDQWTTLYEGRYWVFKEVVRRGAFKRAIAEGQDVRALLNHDPMHVLGRTSSKTLRLKEDEVGLWSEIEVLPTQTNNDLLLAPLGRQDITQMSFSFLPHNTGDEQITRKPDGTVIVERSGERITEYEQNNLIITERELLDADLFDVSPVTFPAYEGTDLGLRSLPFDPGQREQEILNRLGARQRSRKSLVLFDASLRLAEAVS